MIAGAFESNLTITARVGTTVTANASPNTVGTYTQLIAALDGDAHGFTIIVRNIATASTVTSVLLNLAKGAAASETVIAANLHCGAAGPIGSNSSEGGKAYFVPVEVASGERISAQIQAAVGGDTCEVIIFAHLTPFVDLSFPAAITAYGANTGTSAGTSVTPATDDWGTWVDFGATSAAHNLFFLGYGQLADTTTATTGVLVELGRGPNSGAITSMGVFWVSQWNTEAIGATHPQLIEHDVASGDHLWARIASGEAEARDVIIYASEATAPAGGGSGGGPLIGGRLVL